MKPLSGLRVLDVSKVLAGPLCTQYLGDMGADVLKVEPPAVGDDTRRWPPFRGDTGAIFLSCNRNKRSLALDLKTEQGRAIMHRLAAEADIFVESFGPGTTERLGIDEPTLRALNPRLIYCSISGFGRTGPLSHALGYDVILQAFSGIMGISGEPGRDPIRSPFSPIDQTTGLHAFSGIMAALLERSRTGEGHRIEVSLYETALAFLGYTFQIYWEKGVLPEKCGGSHESLCPYQPFAASDKHVLIGVANDGLWRKFCAAVGRPDLGDEPRFATNAGRAEHRAEVVALVQDIVRTRTCDEWVDLLTGLGVPCAPINTLKDILDHPHTAARGMILDYEHPTLGPLKTVAQPIVFDGDTSRSVTPPPVLGQHTREVLRDLGYGDADVEELIKRRIVVDGSLGSDRRRTEAEGA